MEQNHFLRQRLYALEKCYDPMNYGIYPMLSPISIPNTPPVTIFPPQTSTALSTTMLSPPTPLRSSIKPLPTMTPLPESSALLGSSMPSMTPSTATITAPKHLALAASNVKKTQVSEETIKKITAPPINQQELITPQDVLEKYPKLAKKSKITTLAVRLAKEAFFGREHMSYCTYKGVGSLPALPDTEVNKLKAFLHTLCIPQIVTSNVEFEGIYRACVEAVGQACKELRKQRLAKENLK